MTDHNNTPKLKIRVNPNEATVKAVREALEETGGYCPCALFKTDDTKMYVQGFPRADSEGNPRKMPLRIIRRSIGKMTDHKFTDDELQRCIECCIKGKVWGDCKKLNCPAIRKQGCHFYLRTDDDYENTIYIEILKDALDLIKRQKAEGERLKKIGDDKTSEILRHTTAIGELHKQLETAKSEAYKEFAERLRKRARMPLGTLYGTMVYLKDIDTLVKEMTEESK